jgi:hypothetical protein
MLPYCFDRSVAGSAAKAYGIGQMPDTFLIDRRGRVAATYVGMVDRDGLDKNIRELLAQK